MSRLVDNIARRIFVACLTLTVLGGVFLFGALAQSNNLPPMPQLKAAYETIFSDGGMTDSPLHKHLQPSRAQGEGVTINSAPDDGALILLAGFFDEENQIRLIGRDGTVIRKWALNYFEHFPDPDARVCDLASPLRVDTHGAHVTPHGELVFNYEYCGSVKLDQCGEAIWTISEPTHHSLVPAEAGGYWLLGQHKWPASEAPSRLPPFSTPATDQIMWEDTILRISEDGEILEETSIPELMRENGLEALLTANGNDFGSDIVERTDLVHANKVTELPSAIADAYPLFAAGDLAISMRALNLVLVFDPDTKEVKWHQTGPWLRQHDPEFRPDGRISIFNNNVYRTAYVENQTVLSTPFTTNIIAVDPVSRETEIIFGERPGQALLSVIRGDHAVLESDGILITEFDAGRVLEVNESRQVIWEYVNKYNEEFVGEITNSAIYSKDYFQTEWTSCAN